MPYLIKKGCNISHWLSQSDARGDLRKSRFTQKDAQLIAQWGFDHIRIPLDEVQLWTEEGTPIDEAFNLLTQALDWCRQFDLKVIIDLHIIRSHYFNEIEEPPLFSDKRAQTKWGELWQYLSDFLKEYPLDFMAYELLNEPVARNAADWNRIYRIPYDIIRKSEPERTIILGSNFFNQWQTFPELEIPEDENIILTFHYYNPMFITHWKAPWWHQGGFYQGPIQYPGTPVDIEDKESIEILEKNDLIKENRYFDASVMKSDISIPYQIARSKGLRLHCGEFGCRLTTPDEIQQRWYGDLINLFNQWDISWSSWDFKGGFGLLDKDGNETIALKCLQSYDK